MVEDLRSGAARYASIVVLGVTLAVVGFGILSLLPHQPDTAGLGIRSLKELAAAYDRVKPGATRASALARLGFDTSTPNVEVLSYLGVMERFMARDTVAFDKLDVAIQDCIEARDRCTALVFTPSETKVQAAGMLSVFGIDSAKAASGPAEVTLLVQDGRVAYKMIRGVAAPAVRSTTVAARAITVRATTAAIQPVSFRAATNY
ncbi:MAG TPA: hypothetical protein VH023_03910 [Rhodopila sp.]|jgi:hypothetical protein|nr:hypothetical protein [Rhodopila sp.]